MIKYTPEQISETFQNIIERVEAGESVRQILKDLHISTRTFNEWLDADELRQKHYARAIYMRADNIFEEILEIADDSSQDLLAVDKHGNPILNQEFVQRSRVRIDARKWILAKMNPKKYGDSMKLQGDQDNPIKIDITFTD